MGFELSKRRFIMITEIMKEKTSADHLLYVSLKYTKTCDVILNLISRWQNMIEMCFNAMLEKLILEKKISGVKMSPKDMVLTIQKQFKKESVIAEVVPLYIFFRRVPGLEKTREGEFRKNLNLKVVDGKNLVVINLEKLKEYEEILERFISYVKHFLSD